jgi:N6-L-threonylcarbamoyladenine synthase
MKRTRLLAIESSCDDTACAIIEDGRVLSNVVSSQVQHRDLGGVVPELASRAHQVQIVNVVNAALHDSGVSKKELNAVAVTSGPGLLGSLLVGVNFAKALSWALQIPLVEVHHMHAHVMAHFAEEPYPEFPFLCLTVSGGHTQIVLARDHFTMELLGETLDDAAGEAFDKTGKLLGLPYPSGPVIDKMAQKGNAKFIFPSPQIEGLDFSFSGLKTAILYFLRDKVKEQPDFIELERENICASVQKSIVNILIEKLYLAVKSTGIKSIAIAGGVSANNELRNRIQQLAVENDLKAYIPKLEYSTDNAAMIGIAGYYKYVNGITSDLSITPDPRSKWYRSGFR